MSQIRLYFEGNRGLVRPFQIFLERARPQLKGKIRLVPGRRRDDALHDFLLSISRHPELNHVLLVDSEGPDDGRLFAQLTQHGAWRTRGIAPQEQQVAWMVEVMEAWFLADRQTLQIYYGSGFHVNSLPANPQVERISKDDVLHGLKEATRRSAKGAYHKSAHAPRILERLDPDRVQAAATHCQRLLQILDRGVGR